jgi:site-specific DNA-methyltransferase (adenine-specific)
VNQLFYGDNLPILQNHIKTESVDLIYLDPPFNSNQDYNVLFKEQTGEPAQAQIKAFTDTWKWSQLAYDDFLTDSPAPEILKKLITGFVETLGHNDVTAYLVMMAPRLVELHRVLKSTGSLYLHCDPTASHYLKLVLDAIFGPKNFLNEIIWRRTGSHNSSKRYGPIHDTILFYAKSDDYLFKPSFRPYLKGHVDSYFGQSDANGRYWTNTITGAGVRHGESGKVWRGYNPTKAGRHWAIPSKLVDELGIDSSLTLIEKLEALDAAGMIAFPPRGSGALPTYRQYLHLSPGMPLQDLWTYQPHTRGVLYNSKEAIDEDVRWLVAQGDLERMGYATQKPIGLLTRIINSSTKRGDVVLDPFCGCGTAVVTAEKLKRQWIGIDITHLAVALIKYRLSDSFGLKEKRDYEVIGEPTTAAEAQALALQDRDEFQKFAVGLVPRAFPFQAKKGADTGIDGILRFSDDPR